MCRQQLKRAEVGCSVLITLAGGQGAAEVNCASPATAEEGGGIPSVPLMRCSRPRSFISELCPRPRVSTCRWILTRVFSKFAFSTTILATILNSSNSPVFSLTIICDWKTSFYWREFITLFKQMLTALCWFCSSHENSVPKQKHRKYFAMTR